MSVSLAPRGLNFVRSLIALHKVPGGDPESLHAFASASWGAHQADRIAKAATSALLTSDFGTPEAAEFFGLVREQSVIGRLAGLRQVPFNVRVIGVTAGATAAWTGEGKAKPVSRATLAGSTLAPLKVAGIIVATKESVRANRQAETLLRDDMSRAITASLDGAFLDPANAGVANEMPASITNGVTPLSSTFQDPASDVARLIAAFSGDLSAAVFITDPTTATQIAMARDAGGAFNFPDTGPRGGSIVGIPLLVSRASPIDSSGGQLVLVDATGIAANLEGVRVDTSEEASLMMSDDPSGDDAGLVSMFQTNSVAWLSEVSGNWDVQRAGSVAYIAGTNY